MNAYISYHSANFPVDNIYKQSWATAFAENFRVFCLQNGNLKINISSSPNNKNEEVNETALVDSDMLIVVLSTDYANSQVAQKEIDIFLKSHSDKNQLYVISKFDLASITVPEKLQDAAIYEFYEYDADADLIEEYENLGRYTHYKYWVKLDDLVSDLMTSLSEPKSQKTGIYIAFCSIDQKYFRESIIRNLKHQGFNVFPKKPFIYNTPEELKALIQKDLEKSLLSVHLTGELYGESINTQGDSLMSLENELSLYTEHSIKRIIWLPKYLEPLETKQQTYIEYLRSHKDLKNNTFFLESSFEGLKNQLQTLLEKLAQSKQGKSQQNVFFISSDNANFSHQAKKIAQSEEIEIYYAEDAQSWQEQQQKLGNASAVIMCINDKFTSDWTNSWLHNIKKSAGYRTKKSLPKYILISENLWQNQKMDSFILMQPSQIEQELPKILRELQI